MFTTKGIRCPKCGSANVRLSTELKIADLLLSIFLVRPIRCRDCRIRFFHGAPSRQNKSGRSSNPPNQTSSKD
jgi:DNA-directed RNA polymerase subunit RPC12/RpoP